MLDKVYIFAGGKATRNKDATFDGEIPKVLISLGNDTVLDKICESWQTLTSNITFVVSNERWAKQIDQYCKIRDIKISPTIVYEPQDGTLSTVINSIAKDHTELAFREPKNVAICWSDIWSSNIYELEKVVFEFIDKSHKHPQFHIVRDKQSRHRFNADFESGSLSYTPSGDGNVCGIYLLSTYALIELSMKLQNIRASFISETPDILEALMIDYTDDAVTSKLKVSASKDALSIEDIGDSIKLAEYIEKSKVKHTVRYFNSIKISNGVITKTATCDKGDTVCKDEIAWYQKLANVAELTLDDSFKTITPNLIGFIVDSKDERAHIALEYLDKKDGYFTPHELLKYLAAKYSSSASEDFRPTLLRAIDDVMSKIRNVDIKELSEEFESTAPVVRANARYQEYIDTTMSRLMSISSFLRSNTLNVRSVNGHPIISDNLALNIINRKFVNDKPLVFCHGDVNDSNVLVKYDESSHKIIDVKLIDPRGYFGRLKFVGDEVYDKAKLLYGLSGYSEFNNSLDFPKPHISESGDLTFQNSFQIFHRLERLTKNNDERMMVGLIWLKLSAYIINNPIKAMCSYYLGLAMINKYSKQ